MQKSVAFGALVLVVWVGRALAQEYPMPSAVGEPVAYCTTCLDPFKDLPTAQYSNPVKRFVGRYHDSDKIREIQFYPRTLRAQNAFVIPERDRVYMHLGASRFASYRLATFFTNDLNQAGTNLKKINRSTGDGSLKETYLDWYGNHDAETPGSGWKLSFVDGQDRLIYFDWDDRDYIYLGYGPYGWGIIRDNGAGHLPLVGQVSQATGAVMVVKEAGKYYLLRLGRANQPTTIYDVTNPSAYNLNTNPTSPAPVREVPYGCDHFGKTRLASGDRIALATGSGPLQIWRVQNFVAGGPPESSFQPRSGWSFRGITSDGTNFYAAESNDLQTSISVLSPSGGGGAYVETKYLLSTPFRPLTVRYGSNLIGMVGLDSDNRTNVRLYRVGAGAPQEIVLGNFFRHYYYAPPPGFAKPLKATFGVFQPYRHEGKDYVILSAFGIGDVYELQARNVIGVELRNIDPRWGTQNPYSARKTDGPFYGDKIPLRASFEGAATQVLWNFDNIEAGANGTRQTTTGESFTYQYSGITTADAIGRLRTISAQAINDATNNDALQLQLLVPEARFRVINTDVLFTQPNASSPAAIVFGDQFGDASDGSVESHYANWILDGVSSNSRPNEPVPVGLCGGPRSAQLVSHYVPYTVSGSTVTPGLADSLHFKPVAGPVTYSVRPFVAGIALGPYTASTVTFVSASRFSPASVFASGTSASFKWELLGPTGNVKQTQELPGTIGGASSFSVTKSLILPGDSIKLTITLPTGAVVEPSCSAGGFLVSTATYALKLPDPKINKPSGQCTHVNGPCTLTAESISNADQTGWTYEWKLNNSVAGSAKTFTPNFATPGNYTVALRAISPVGDGTATPLSLTVEAPTCAGKPRGITFRYEGVNTGCGVSGPCTQREPLKFTPQANFGYTLQECDTFLWNFGDGGTSTEKTPTHSFSTNGPHTVTLTVRNSSAADAVDTYSQVIFFGSGPPPTCVKPTGSVSIQHSAVSCSGADTSCTVNQAIAFSAKFTGYSPQACDFYSWDFGDGTSSISPTPQKTYSSNGTRTVRLTVSNTSGALPVATLVLTLSGGQDDNNNGNCAAAAGRPAFEYDGASTHCGISAEECSRTEEVTFEAKSGRFGGEYKLQDCDVYNWNFGDGQTATGKTAKHVFSGAAAEYVVTLTITAGGNSISSTKTIKLAGVGVTAPTAVQIDGPTSGLVDVPMTFFGTATVPANGPVTAWLWSFKNPQNQITSQTTTTGTINPTFNQPGTWTITLQARNAGGTSAPVVKLVTVSSGTPFAYMLPVVTHVQGRQTFWHSDLHVFSPDHTGLPAKNLKLTVEFAGKVKELEVTSSTFVYPDFLTFFGVENDFGPVKVSGIASHPPHIWVRTYNVSPSGGSFGQVIPAVPMTHAELSIGEPAYIAPGLRQDQNYRTNIGIVNMSPVPTRVTVTAYDHRFESAIGSFTETIDAFQLLQVSNLELRIRDLPLQPFSLSFSSEHGVPLAAYASIVDKQTSDARLLMAVPDSRFSGAELRHQVVPVIAPTAEWRTDLTIFNLDAGSLEFKLSYYDVNGSKLKESTVVTVNPRSFVYLEDVLLRTLELTSMTNGILRVETLNTVSKYPLISARTYKTGNGGGTYGQGVMAFAAEKVNVEQGKPAFVAAVKNDESTRTKIGLVNAGNEPALIRISLLDSSTGDVRDEWSWSLNPDSSVIRDIFEAMGSTEQKGSLKIEVTGGGVWAFASMEDQKTGDLEYIPAAPQE